MAFAPPNGTSSALESEETLSRQRPTPSINLECQPAPPYTSQTDPFRLSSRLRSSSEIKLISANTSRKRDVCHPMVLTGQKPMNELQGFYEAQNERIERFLRPVDEHVRQAKETNASNRLRYQVAVYGSFAANIVLAMLQVYAAIASGSLSFFTTMADAIFDPASNLTLLLCHSAIAKVDARKFPAGKARIETAGNILFCFLMSSVSFILIAFSIQDLASHRSTDADAAIKTFHLAPVIAVSIAFVTKLTLFLYCWALRNHYSQVRILWQDHRNDLCINGFGLLTSIGGSKLRWWIDPAGAIILSLLIATLWLRTSYHEFQLLVGVTADTETQQLITYISMTYSTQIQAIDTVRAWHSGPRLVVEVDVVMAATESLKTTHDVAEELQMKIESLPGVERAYVHVDYETTHKPEHFLKKEL